MEIINKLKGSSNELPFFYKGFKIAKEFIMNEKTKADLTPQGIYDYLMSKPADIKGFAKDFKIAFKVQLDRPQNAQYF